MSLHFDVTGTNENFLRKLEETKRGVSEAAKFMEGQGKKIDSSLNSVGFGDTLKKQIYEGSQSINGLTAQIIKQKAVIKDIEHDVRNLGEAYRRAGAGTPKGNALFADYGRAKGALQEEKAGLFDLQTQQAQARLSVRKLKDEYSLYQKEGQNVIDSNNNMALSFKKTLAAVGGVAALKQLGSEIIKVRGEFQSMQTAIETLVGKDMASNLIPQIKEIAKVSPLTLSDMVGAEKMMLGFNIKAEDTIRYLQALGDISMGNSQKFNSMTLAFSQMSATGKLMGQDLNQMINAGFNPLQQIAQSTGKSIATLKDEMSKGAISTEMVQKAFIDATSAGGKFFGMSENASKTINGQLSMMQDALDEVFNELGTKGEGVIMAGIQASTSLIQNYETVGKVLSGLVVTYGGYRTAVMLSTIATGKHTIAEVALTNVRVIARRAQMALNASMLTNPYVLLATVVVGAAVAMWAFHDGTTAAEKAQDSYNKKVEDAAQKSQDHKQKLEGLISELQNEVTAETRKMEILDEIKKGYPSLFQKFIDEKGHIKDLTEAWKAYNEEASKNNAIQNKDNVNGLKESIAEQRRFLELFDMGINDRQKSISSSPVDKTIWNKYNSKGTLNIKKDIETGERELWKWEKGVRDDEFTQWKVDLKGKTAEQIKAIRESMVSRSKSAKGDKNLLSALGKRIIALDEEKNSRKASSVTYGTDFKAAKTEWETAKKELDAIEKNKDKYTRTQYDNAKKREETAEKAYKDLGGVANNAKQESAAEKLRKEQEKRNEELLALQKNNQKSQVDLMKEGSEKKIAQVKLDYENEIAAIKKQEKEWSKAQGGKLTEEQSQKISIAYTQAEDKKDKGVSDVAKDGLKAEQQALNDYLKEYGTFQQQKLAIAEEYAEKIKQAQEENGVNSAQVKLLEKQRDVAIQNKETEAIKANIDWVTVFGEFGGMFNDMIKPALEDAKKYVQTDKFENSDQASQKSLIDAINQMEKSLGGAGGMSFKKLGQEMQAYQSSLRDLNTAKNEEIDAINKLKKAQEDYEKAVKSGTDQEKQTTKESLDTAQQNADAASTNVKTQTDAANQSQQNVTRTATGLQAAMNNVTGGLNKLASGGLSSAYSGIIQATNGIKDAIGKTSESLREVPIIGWILSIIDVFKDGLSNFVGPLLDSIFNAISGIISDVLSGDIFVTIAESLSKGIFNIVKSIVTLGGTFSFMDAESDPDLQKDIDRLTASNERLEDALDRLADKMDDAETSEATSVYKEQLDNAKNREKNTQEMIQREASAWARSGYGFAGMGGKGSSNSKIDGNISGTEWSEISKVVGRNISSAGDFWGLSSEEMAKVADEAGWIYDKIKGYADDGHKDAAKYMDDYISYAKEREELEKAYYEKLTNTSFDSVRDEFKNALLDMESDAEDFTENFEKMMQNAIIESMMTEKYDKKLKEWYRKFGDAMEDGEMTQDEKETLKNDYNDIVNDGLKDRDVLKDTLGLSSSSSSQSSTQKGFETISQDTGEELNGRFTALQISNEEIKNSMLSMLTGVNLISTTTAANGITLMEIRNLAISSNSYLEDIAGFQKKIVTDFGQRLESIDGGIKRFNSK